MVMPDYDEIYDDPDGSLMGYLLYPAGPGEDITCEDVEFFLAGEHTEMHGEYDYEGHPTAPEGGWEITECYVRKVPGPDGYGGTWMTYHYQDHPGRGARRCVRVEKHSFWGHWCHNHIDEPATTGIPVEQFTPESLIWPFVQVRITPPEQRRPARGGRGAYPQDGEAMVYLCGACASSHHARYQRAQDLQMIKFYRERGQEQYATQIEERLRLQDEDAASEGAVA